MDDATAQAKRDALNTALEGAQPDVGIAFGLTLFDEFVKREWFTLETFGALGTTLLSSKVPTYDRTHYVFATSDVDEEDFKVGK
jgi:hypothetical protein